MAEPARGRGGDEGRPSSELLEARGVSFGYGKLPVVKDLDLKVSAGEVVALLGANGAGKSTTLLGLAGELTPGTGSVHWRGQPVKTPTHVRCRQGLGFVPEERSVIFGLSVHDNLRLGQGGIDAALEIAPELGKLMKRKAGLLSGGEQQILTLARALAAKPRVLLADELSLGLAPLITQRLLTILREQADTRGMGVLVVEQHVRQALKFADHVYVIRRGQVVLSGPKAQMAARMDEIEAAYL